MQNIRVELQVLVADLNRTLADPTQAWDIALADFQSDLTHLITKGAANGFQ